MASSWRSGQNSLTGELVIRNSRERASESTAAWQALFQELRLSVISGSPVSVPGKCSASLAVNNSASSEALNNSSPGNIAISFTAWPVAGWVVRQYHARHRQHARRSHRESYQWPAAAPLSPRHSCSAQILRRSVLRLSRADIGSQDS